MQTMTDIIALALDAYPVELAERLERRFRLHAKEAQDCRYYASGSLAAQRIADTCIDMAFDIWEGRFTVAALDDIARSKAFEAAVCVMGMPVGEALDIMNRG